MEVVSELINAIRVQRLKFDPFRNLTHWEITYSVIQADLDRRSIDHSGLASTTGRARGTVMAQVNHLKNSGYLDVISDTNDSRRRVVVPTEKLRTEYDEFARLVAPAITRASFKLQQENPHK